MMGPADHDEEHDQEGNTELDLDREAARRSVMHEQADEASRHANWIGDNLDTKGNQTGLRAGTNNFQRKLYGSPANSTEALLHMQRLGMNMLLATEPGQGTPTNMNMLRDLAAHHTWRVITMNRDDSTIGGGMALILDEAWAKIPTTTMVYEPAIKEMCGRVMAVTFNNRIQGMQNKLLVIGVHAPNSAERNLEDVTRMLKWIQRQITEFERDNPLATVMLLGELNAAVNTYLDTTRQEYYERDEDREE